MTNHEDSTITVTPEALAALGGGKPSTSRR